MVTNNLHIPGVDFFFWYTGDLHVKTDISKYCRNIGSRKLEENREFEFLNVNRLGTK